MSELISLEKKKNIVGLSNVIISEIDGTIFINSRLEVENGTKGSLSFYINDGQKISSTGENIKYDEITKQLYISKLSADSITGKIIFSDTFAFNSKFCKDSFPYKLRLWSDPRTNKESLLLITNDYENKKLRGGLEINGERFCFRETLNILPSLPLSPIGSLNDVKGDVKIDGDYIYVCCKNYDGVSKIWKRSSLLDW